MIFTTNKPLSEWGKVLHDEDLAAAILDRVLERGRLIHLGGPSGRTRHLNLEEVLPEKSERVRISGNNGSEFPEPQPYVLRLSSRDRCLCLRPNTQPLCLDISVCQFVSVPILRDALGRSETGYWHPQQQRDSASH